MVELIAEVDLIPLMELTPVVEPIPVIDMIPTIMIPIPTYPHCSMDDSNSDSQKNWNHNTSNRQWLKNAVVKILIPSHFVHTDRDTGNILEL